MRLPINQNWETWNFFFENKKINTPELNNTEINLKRGKNRHQDFNIISLEYRDGHRWSKPIPIRATLPPQIDGQQHWKTNGNRFDLSGKTRTSSICSRKGFQAFLRNCVQVWRKSQLTSKNTGYQQGKYYWKDTVWWRITEAHCLVTILYLENKKTHFTEGSLNRALGHSISSITTILKEIYQFENDCRELLLSLCLFHVHSFHVPVSSLSCLQRLWKSCLCVYLPPSGVSV